MTDDLPEASRLVINFLLPLTDLLLDSVAHLPLSLHGGLLAHHLALVVALLNECRLTVDPVWYQVN